MSIEATFGSLFKPEMRSSGRKLVAQEKVSLSSHSETAVLVYIRVAPPFKVTLTAADVASHSFVSDCSCPVAKKSRFCKHVWAALLIVEEKYPDFLIGKTEINHVTVDATEEAVPSKQAAYQETAKQRANDYRKEQYQKQKARIKDKKRAAKGLESATSQGGFTAEVEEALSYFSVNGFPMPEGPSREILTEAKRTLARVFHPDKGGSHEEFVELNEKCDLILQFLGG